MQYARQRYDCRCFRPIVQAVVCLAAAAAALGFVAAPALATHRLFEIVPDGANGRPWNPYDLTTVSSGPPILGNPAALNDDDRLHVYYRSTNDRLIEITDSSGRWASHDLSAAVGGQPITGDPDVEVVAGLPLVYAASDGHLFEWRFDGAWRANDVTQRSGAPAIAGRPAVAIVGSQPQVLARSTSGAMLLFVRASDGSWTWWDLTSTTSAPSIAGSPDVVMVNGSPQVFARTAQNHLILLVYGPDGTNWRWTWHDISVLVGRAGPISDPTAVLVDGAPRVYTVDTGGSLTETMYGRVGAGWGWTSWDLSTQAGTPPLANARPAVLRDNGTPHVFARSESNHLIDTVYDDGGGAGWQWRSYDITSASGGQTIGGAPSVIDSDLFMRVYARDADPADTGPYARVLDANGNVVAQFGAYYGAQGGSQIQMAENYAQCRQITERCSGSARPAYPTVRLDSGTYQLQRPFGGVWPKCVGILAYSGVKLEGSSDAVIENDITGPTPCAGMSAPLDAVVYATADSTNINVTGDRLDISGFRINADDKALFGLEVGPHSGGGLTVHDLTVTKPQSSGILVGVPTLPVRGTSGSPVMVTGNVVQDSHDDGITLGGSWQKAQGNIVTNVPDHGIVIYQPAGTDHNEISNNTITNATYGVSLDASTAAGDPAPHTGTDNSVYNNTIGNTCLGIILYRQIKANVAGNYIYGGRPSASCRSEPIFGTSVGIGIQASYNNVAWSNQTWDYSHGVWIQDNGDSPDGIGTRYNYIGVVASWGQPWPWPTAGNWINGAAVGMRVNIRPGTTGIDEGNAFIGNVVSGASVTACSFDSPQVLSGNSPSPPC